MFSRTQLFGAVFSFHFLIFYVQCLQSQNVISLDASKTYQTIVGWEAMSWLAQFDNRYQIDNVQKWRQVVADGAVNEVGINRIRLEIRSGAENPVDYFGQYIDDQIPRSGWGSNRYSIINDNNDPFIIDPLGFAFTELDYTIENVALPVRNAAIEMGEDLYINLTYVDFDASSFEHYNNPNEYAELILAVFQHIDSKYGWVPDALEVILEPDVAPGWSANQVGTCLVAAAQRLESNGYTPDFIAPSNTSMSNALNFFDDLFQVAGVSDYLTELAYHRYSGVSTSTLEAIAQRGVSKNIGTSMLEWWNSNNTYQTLHQDLKIGNNTGWQRGVLAELGRPNNKVWLFTIDDSDPDNPQVIMNNGTKYIRQYFKFIRRGAVRIEAVSTNNNFDPLAFINTDGRYVVVVKADNGGSFSIEGLPTGTYGIKYTTGRGNNPPSEYDVDLQDIVVSGGQSLNANIPNEGVITIYAKSISTPVELSFFGGKVRGTDVVLTWRTRRESNSYGFEIQRSLNNVDYHKIGFVESQGNSSSVIEYTFMDKNVTNGRYYYRLNQIDLSGDFELSGIVEVNVDAIDDFILYQNHPNPFNAETVIRYYVPTASRVRLKVMNLRGQEVATLVDTLKPAGDHRVTWDASRISSGVYLYRLETEGFSQTKKLLLVR